MNILERIMVERMADVAEARRLVPEKNLLEQAEARKHHSLKDRLSCGSAVNVIAEVKKASPSAGLLMPDYRPGEIAHSYRDAGAAGISVLTEPRHFMGSEHDLSAVRNAVDIPVLRKDFMCDEYQIYETAAWGGDVVLLIVAVLGREKLASMYRAAMEVGLDVLVEAHTEEEVGLALELECAIIGVNSRNLKTLQTDLHVACRLAAIIPASRISVAESGIRTRSDINELAALGYRGFLVGEVLMSSGNPGGKLAEFLIAN